MATLDHNRRNKKPRLITDAERERLEEFIDSIHYSARLDRSTILWYKTVSQESSLLNRSCRYSDDEYEYRHVQLPKPMLKAIPKDYFDPSKQYIMKLLWEEEWRGLGITQVIHITVFHVGQPR